MNKNPDILIVEGALSFMRSKGASESMMHEFESALGRLIVDGLTAKELVKEALPWLACIADVSDEGTCKNAPAIGGIYEVRQKMDTFLSSLPKDRGSGKGVHCITMESNQTFTGTHYNLPFLKGGTG